MVLDSKPPRCQVAQIPKLKHFPQPSESSSAASPQSSRGIKAGYSQAQTTYKLGGSAPAAAARRSRSQVPQGAATGPALPRSDSADVWRVLSTARPDDPLPAPHRGLRVFATPVIMSPPSLGTRSGKRVSTPIAPSPSPIATEATPKPERTLRRLFTFSRLGHRDPVTHETSVTKALDGAVPVVPAEKVHGSGVRRSRSTPIQPAPAPFGTGDGVAPKPPNPRPIRVYETRGLLDWA